ncbi:MAG TPA: hypothetical protein VFP58_10245 [Candidatus Eisenbacteria bacterium]|nr:hypothetical protein [Candidatus Eisenbacteria bacterium]
MLINRDEPAARDKLRSEIARERELDVIVQWLDVTPEPVRIEADRAGLEVSPGGEGGEAAAAPRRCRLKVFRAREGKDRFCAFFYKRSNLPWSRDRFSYGGVEFLPGRVTQSEVQSWVRWLTSGLDPEQRPERLRRSFLYDIPD